MVRVRLLLALMVSAGACALSACGGSSPTTASPTSVGSATTTLPTPDPAAAEDQGTVLLSITAEAAYLNESSGTQYLTLRNPAPETIWFDDRPERANGSFPTAELPRRWSVDPTDPPNMALSGQVSGEVTTTVLVASDPSFANGDLQFRVELTHDFPEGELSDVALFIDPTCVDILCWPTG